MILASFLIQHILHYQSSYVFLTKYLWKDISIDKYRFEIKKKDRLGLILVLERNALLSLIHFPKSIGAFRVLLLNKPKSAVGIEWLHMFIFLCSFHHLFLLSLLYFHSTKALLLSVLYCLVTIGTSYPLTSLTILSSIR